VGGRPRYGIGNSGPLERFRHDFVDVDLALEHLVDNEYIEIEACTELDDDVPSTMSWSISVARVRPLTLGFKLAPESLLLRTVMVDHTQSTSRFSH
jgi:hypothetical protein